MDIRVPLAFYSEQHSSYGWWYQALERKPEYCDYTNDTVLFPTDGAATFKKSRNVKPKRKGGEVRREGGYEYHRSLRPSAKWSEH